MDYCNQIRTKYMKDLFPQSLGIKILHLSPGYSRVEMQIKENMTNLHGTTHGGALFTLADTAFGLASNSRGPAVALQVSINFIAPSVPGQTLTAVAREEQLTRSTGIYNIVVENEHSDKIALFRGVVYRKKQKETK